MTAEQLLSVYIDTNLVLLIVGLTWFVSKRLFARTRLRRAYLTQLHVLYGLLAMVVLAPAVVCCLDAGQSYGAIGAHTGLRLSDFLVAQYLYGNIAMAPTTFEHMLMLRTEFTREIATLATWPATLTVVAFVAAAVYVMGRNLREAWKLSRIIRRSFVLRRAGRIDVRFTDETRVPFSTRGLTRYYIVLPTDLLAQSNDVRIAVSHEIQHVRQGDLTWEILLELVRALFFWNPAFVYCKRHVERLRELACDQQVLSRNTHNVRAYCECLLRVCRTSLGTDRSNQIMTPSVPFVYVDRSMRANHSASFLRVRILSLLERPSKAASRRIGHAVMMTLCAVVVWATATLQPANDWSHDRLMLSTIVNLERLNSRSVTP